MTKNKIVMTGLALYHDTDPEHCSPCNFDVSWIFDFPSTLLWADSILVTPTIIETGLKGGIYQKDQPEIGDVLRVFFDIVGSYGLFDLKNPTSTITKEILGKIEQQAHVDRVLLAETFPETVRLDIEERLPGGFAIGQSTYCVPFFVSTYVSMYLARVWDAQIILSSEAHHLLKHVLGLRTNELQTTRAKLRAFTEVSRGILPEINIRPAATCWSCKKGDSCDKHVLKMIEKELKEYLLWREYDEVIQMKILFSNLSQRLQAETEEELTAELVGEFKKEERKINTKLRKVFPKVSRWSSVATISSVPIIVAGLATGMHMLAGLGGAVAGVATVGNKYMEYVTSKHRWVFFKQELTGSHRILPRRPKEDV